MAAISVGAPITSTSGHSVQVQGRTAGSTVTLNGTVGDSGAGILLTGNAAGAQINFNGAITATTGTSPAFTATGGGTVTATSSTSSLTHDHGRRARCVGRLGDRLRGSPARRRSPPDASQGPTNGIVLNGTGAAGNVTIAGGTIQHTTGAGIQVTDAGTVSLAGMMILASGGDGIDADNVESLSIAHTDVAGSGARGIAVTGDGSVARPQSAGLGFDTISGQPGTAISLALRR